MIISSCYRTVPIAIWEIFSEFLIFCNLTAKYEKRGKYFPRLHEATCDNYFIVKCLSNKMYQELSYLLIVSGLLNII